MTTRPTFTELPTDRFDCPLLPFLKDLAGAGAWTPSVHPDDNGFELIPPAGEAGYGRCRIRVMKILTGKDTGRWIAFFYKTSAVPHSQDRYSYGAAVFDGRLKPETARAWILYLESRFDPERTPADVRRALTVDLPPFTPIRRAEDVPVAGNGATVIAGETAGPARVLNPGELEVDLFCRGIRIDPSCALEQDARVFSRTRAGLGSGLELVIPGPLKELWLNVPVEEDFAQDSPYLIVRGSDGSYRVVDDRLRAGGFEGYPVRLPPEPKWYTETTSRGTRMSRVGVLQGTYLGIYISNSCGFWYHKPEAGCHFCTTGLNVGVNEVVEKDVQDVVEVALAAKKESGNTFVHFNSGFHGGDRNLEAVAPYVKAIKEQVGALVGVQVVPSPNLWKYDWMIDLGVDHFSFCYEFHNPEYFAKYLPGKERLVGQDTFFRAMEYCVNKMGKGSCSGEIIAGVEPVEDTLMAIDYITKVGAFPTVCIFRPTIGAAMERFPSPDSGEMLQVMRHMYDACRRNCIPIGLAPNIEVSLIVNPDDARYLVKRDWKVALYEKQLALMKMVAKPIFARRMQPRKIRADASSPAAYAPVAPASAGLG